VRVVGLGEVVLKGRTAGTVTNDPARLTMVVVAQVVDRVADYRFSSRPRTVVEMVVPGIPLHVPHSSTGRGPETPGAGLVVTEMTIPFMGVMEPSMDEQHVERARKGGGGRRNDREADQNDPHEQVDLRSPADFAQPKSTLRLGSMFCWHGHGNVLPPAEEIAGVLAPRMAAVPARHAQVTSGKLISLNCSPGPNEMRPSAIYEQNEHSTTLGRQIRNRIYKGFGPSVGPGDGRIIQRLVLRKFPGASDFADKGIGFEAALAFELPPKRVSIQPFAQEGITPPGWQCWTMGW